MKFHSLLSIAAALLLGGAVGTISHARHRDSSAVRAARDFLTAIGPEKAQKARYPFEHEERFNWHFVPRQRNGISFKEMNAEQQKAAAALLNIGVSVEGMKRLQKVRELETVLLEMEQGRGPTRDPDLYFLTIFGEPSDKGVWGWRYEGHHVSLQWTMRDGQVIGSTPQFLGANPAEVRSGPMKGTRVLAAEEDIAYELLRSLSETQRKDAILNAVAPSDIVTGNSRKAAIQEDKGVSYREMTPAQQKVLMALITQHAALQSPELAKKRLALVRSAGVDDIRFAWMGAMEPGKGHYYRVQGKTFLIEFDNTQNDANHIHAVWRDFAGDFGLDLLAEHYRSAH